VSEVRKVSVSMPPAVVDKVRRAAEATGMSVSAWLTRAAEESLDAQARVEIGRIAAGQLLAEHEVEHGPIPQQVYDEVDAFFEGPGAHPLDRAPGGRPMRDAG
jgi:hypothetical protein